MPKLDEPLTRDQQKRMFAMLTDIANQVEWPVNGKMQKLDPADFKDIFSAELRKEQRIAQGLSGGFVMLGAHTSKMKKREISEIIELMFAFGAEKNVIWSDPTVETF